MDESIRSGHPESPGPNTGSSSLLQLVEGRNPEAWRRLIRLYGPWVYCRCRRSGLPAADAAEVLQDVFHSVATGVSDVLGRRPGDSFRSWLGAVTREKVQDHFRSGDVSPTASVGSDLDSRQPEVSSTKRSTPGGADPSLADSSLVHRAMQGIRREFHDSTWDAFWRMTVQGHSSAKVAHELGMTRGAVRQARYRVLRRLRRELDDSSSVMHEAETMAETPDRGACPAREGMIAYLLGTLPEEEAAHLVRHLQNCSACGPKVAALEDSADPLLAQLREPVGPEVYTDEPEYHQALEQLESMVRAASSPSGGSADVPLSGITSLSGITKSQQLREYRLLEKLGSGGMGTVYKALHTKLDRVVALKVLRGDQMEDDRAGARFEREMKAIGRLDHPNVVRAQDAGEVDGTCYLVMEYVAGLNLTEVSQRYGRLKVADGCELIRQAALGLQCAHEHGLVHRDVKPSNLMLTPGGQVKLLDLGLARFQLDQPVGEEMTMTGQAMGTADYIAPEQASDSHSVDIRADVYSLGCTMYRLLAGRAPFTGEKYQGPLQKMSAHIKEQVPPIDRFRPDLPGELVAVLNRMLAKKPGDRFTTPIDVAQALEPFCTGCDLPGLLRGAQSESDTSSQSLRGGPDTFRRASSALVSTQQSYIPRLAVAAGQLIGSRRRPWAIAGGLLLVVALAALAFSLLGRGGEEYQQQAGLEGGRGKVEGGRGKEIPKSEICNLKSLAPSPYPPAANTISTPADFPESWVRPKPVVPNIEPEPSDFTAGAPLGSLVLVGEPAAIEGIDSWTVETRAHRGEVHALAYSPPDGKRLATGSENGIIRVWDSASGELLRALVAHDADITSLSWSPDGKYLASGSSDRTVRLWDVQSGRRLRTLRGHFDGVLSVSWSPDGRSVASGGKDSRIRVWEVGSKKAPRVLVGHTGTVLAVAFSPDGKMLASGGDDKTAKLWDAESGAIRYTFEGYNGAVVDLAFSPRHKLLASGGAGRENREASVHIWNAQTGEHWHDLVIHPGGEDCLAFSPDGKALAAVGNFEQAVAVWDVAAGRMLCRWGVPSGMSPVRCMAYSSDGKTLSVACAGGIVQLLDARSGQPRRVLPGRAAWLQNLGLLFGGRYPDRPGLDEELVYVVLTSKGQRTFDPRQFAATYGWEHHPQKARPARVVPKLVSQRISPETLQWPAGAPLSRAALVIRPAAIKGVDCWTLETRGHRGPVRAVAYSPDGKLLCTAGDDGVIRFWAPHSGEVERILIAHDGPIKDLSWSHDGTVVASAGTDRTIRLWEAGSGRILRTLRGHSDAVNAVAWSRDGLTLASGGADRTICLWDISSGKTRHKLSAHHGAVLALGFSPDGRLLASGAEDGTVRLWDSQSAQMLGLLAEHSGEVVSLAFSPDGTVMASASRTPNTIGSVGLFSLKTGKPLPSLTGRDHGNSCLGWSPDGELLAAGSPQRDGTVQIWNPQTKELVHTLGEDGRMGVFSASSLDWSPDAKTLAVGGTSGRVRIWDGISGRLVRTLPAHAARVACVAFSADEATLAFGCNDGTVRFCQTDSGRLLRQFTPQVDAVKLLAWSPDAKTLAATYFAGGLVETWDAVSAERLKGLRYSRGSVESITWSPDGQSIGIGGLEAQLWDAESGELRRNLPGQGNCLAFSPDGNTLVLATGGDVRILDAGSNKIGRVLYGSRIRLRTLAFTADGNTLAAGGDDKKVYVWDVQSGRMKATYTAHQGPVVALGWLEGGGSIRLASGSETEVCTWEPRSGRRISTIACDGGTFAPENRLVASRGQSMIRLRQLDDGQLLRTIVPLRDEGYAVVSPDGHYTGSPGLDDELVYVVQTDQGQRTFSTDEFSKQYDWKNDPEE